MPPANFDSYWDNLDTELAEIPARPVVEELPIRSNEHCTVYALRLTSIGPYRIFGYLSIPRGEGAFPALLQTPRYGSVNHIPDYNDRMRYVCLQIMHRGQRLADQPYAAQYPGLLTDGIEDPDRYVYRGIVADCLRAAEYLATRNDVDHERIAVQGDDLALITAARRPGFALVNASGLIFYRLLENRRQTASYPIEEINDYLRVHPDALQDVERTLAFLDPLHHACKIESEAILAIPEGDWHEPLVDALGDRCQVYRLTHRGGTDHDNIDRLIAGRLGANPMSRFIREFAG